jgi:hypothetical protein
MNIDLEPQKKIVAEYINTKRFGNGPQPPVEILRAIFDLLYESCDRESTYIVSSTWGGRAHTYLGDMRSWYLEKDFVYIDDGYRIRIDYSEPNPEICLIFGGRVGASLTGGTYTDLTELCLRDDKYRTYIADLTFA